MQPQLLKKLLCDSRFWQLISGVGRKVAPKLNDMTFPHRGRKVWYNGGVLSGLYRVKYMTENADRLALEWDCGSAYNGANAVIAPISRGGCFLIVL